MNNNINENAGRRIREIRKNLGLTLKEFGEKLDPPASDSLVSRWERNVNAPNRERMKQIAELGNINVNELTKPGERERIVQLVEKLENISSVNDRYKQLYHPDFKYNLINEIHEITKGNYPEDESYKYDGLNFEKDNVVLEIIRHKIYDKDRTSKYLPFTIESSIDFSIKELSYFSYDITRILKENDVNTDLINDIENQLKESRFHIEDLKNKYDDETNQEG